MIFLLELLDNFRVDGTELFLEVRPPIKVLIVEHALLRITSCIVSPPPLLVREDGVCEGDLLEGGVGRVSFGGGDLVWMTFERQFSVCTPDLSIGRSAWYAQDFVRIELGSVGWKVRAGHFGDDGGVVGRRDDDDDDDDDDDAWVRLPSHSDRHYRAMTSPTRRQP